MDRSYALLVRLRPILRGICTTIVVTKTKAMGLNDEALTMSVAGMNPQTIAQALGHQTARMALQFYGPVTDTVADQARKETFARFSWL